MVDIDYDHCWVCGVEMGPDRLHIMIGAAGYGIRHTYCCRKHRYVVVELTGGHSVVQERSDQEIESLASAFRARKLAAGWE